MVRAGLCPVVHLILREVILYDLLPPLGTLLRNIKTLQRQAEMPAFDNYEASLANAKLTVPIICVMKALRVLSVQHSFACC